MARGFEILPNFIAWLMMLRHHMCLLFCSLQLFHGHVAVADRTSWGLSIQHVETFYCSPLVISALFVHSTRPV
jgi:hypothetical protein